MLLGENSKKGKRVFLYTRVSTVHQVDGYSLEAQTKELERYVRNNEMEIIESFSDEGKSGKTIEGRPDFSRMISLLRKMLKKMSPINLLIMLSSLNYRDLVVMQLIHYQHFVKCKDVVFS